MASYDRGKICILLLFSFLSIFRNVSCVFVSGSSTGLTDCSQVSTDRKFDAGNGVSTPLYLHQQAQIDRLEQLVKNLTELVAKLESRYNTIPRIEKVAETTDFHGSKSNYREMRFRYGEIESDEIKEGGRSTKYSAFWSEQFRFVSAVNLDSIATSMNVLPFRDFEGHSKYVAVGDDHGRVYVLLRNGDVLIEFCTLSESPVTAMISYMSVYKNESFVVTGHSSGAILVHRVWEGLSTDGGRGLFMENVLALNSVSVGETPSALSVLEIHHVGRLKYILSADVSGRIKVFRENGELYGLVVPTSRPLAFLKQRLLFLTETGAGSLDLRTMKIKEVHCEGLNHSVARSYVFDPTERLKAYGVTSNGYLIHVLLLGDATNIKCRARAWENVEIDQPIAFQVIKGYLLIADQENLYVYNISSQHYSRSGAPRLVFSSGIDEITSLSVTSKEMSKDFQEKRVLLMASDRDKLVALGFGGGCVGLYRSNLPVMKSESSSILWTTPVLFFILFLIGAWHLFVTKKEVLTSWGEDDPFSSGGASLRSSGSGDRSFPELSSRNAESMNLRGNGFSSSRRYDSPTRYSVGGGNSFRPNSTETSSRPSVEPHFKGGSELKFRGSNLELSGYPKRRENIHISSQVLDESG